MSQTLTIALITSLTGMLLAACSEQASDAPVAADSPPPITAENPLDRFNTTATIRDIMNTLIDPNADALWNAVSYVATEEGIEERFPQTDEDWSRLRMSAIAMIEGANSLMIPGRQVAAPGAITEFPEYEYLPEEVQQQLDQDPFSWIGFTQAFQAVSLQLLEAVEDNDIIDLTEFGGRLDQTCETCHAQYWYRRLE